MGIRDSIRDIRHEVRAAVFSDVNATAHAAVPLKANRKTTEEQT